MTELLPVDSRRPKDFFQWRLQWRGIPRILKAIKRLYTSFVEPIKCTRKPVLRIIYCKECWTPNFVNIRQSGVGLVSKHMNLAYSQICGPCPPIQHERHSPIRIWGHTFCKNDLESLNIILGKCLLLPLLDINLVEEGKNTALNKTT